MPTAILMLIIAVVMGGATLTSILINRRKPTKMGQRITYAIAVISPFAVIISGGLSYCASIETEEELQLAHAKVSEVGSQADRARAQIAEIRTPRRMEPDTKRMLVARLKSYAGQKYDIKVFRDRDSLELATAIQAILEEARWVYTNVYPTYATRYAETRGDGVYLISGKGHTRKTSEARMALHGALIEAGLYDDSTAITPIGCVEATGPIQEGTKLARIPCSESPIRNMELGFRVTDDVIPEDTLVLHLGKERL